MMKADQLMRKCQSKDPSKCKIHGTGGQVQKLELEASQALEKGDSILFFRLKEQLENIQDDAENIITKENFFNRLKSRIAKTKVSSTGNSEPKMDVSPEIARQTLVKYFSISDLDQNLADRVTPILNDFSKTVTSENSDASAAVEEVYGMLWDNYSEHNENKRTGNGSIAAATATAEIFYRLRRENELGWVKNEAPKYSYTQYIREELQKVSWAEPKK